MTSEQREPVGEAEWIALRRVLTVDACGVSALTGLATLVAVGRPRRLGDGESLLAAAVVGMAGLACAVGAVWLAARAPGAPRAPRGPRAPRAPLRLIAAGFLVNTVGSVAVLRALPRSLPGTVAAVVLLVFGSVLSALYARELKRLQRRRSRVSGA